MRISTPAVPVLALALAVAGCDQAPLSPNEGGATTLTGDVAGEIVPSETVLEAWDFPVDLEITGSIVGGGTAAFLREWRGELNGTFPAEASFSVSEFRGTPVEGRLNGHLDVKLESGVVREMRFSLGGHGDLAGLVVELELEVDGGSVPTARAPYEGSALVAGGG